MRERGAAEMILDRELDGEKLAASIRTLYRVRIEFAAAGGEEVGHSRGGILAAGNSLPACHHSQEFS